MAITLTPRSLTQLPIHGAALRPDQWANLQLSEIGCLNLRQGNRYIPVAELFDIQGDPTDQVLLIQGDIPQIDSLGQGLSTGQIIVQGSVGNFCAAEQTGGTVIIHGSVGDSAAVQISGGLLVVHGNAGQNLAGVFPGSVRGQRGGTVIVQGNVGSSLGQYQRRGLIVVLGNAGHEAGYHQLAGSIILGGKVGSSCGRAQRRGTIWLLETPEQLATTFDPGRVIAGYQGLPVAKQVMGKQVIELCQTQRIKLSAKQQQALAQQPIQLLHSDLLELNRAECWLSCSL
jgi:formylmethanofuran dehydrogenase subunit C